MCLHLDPQADEDEEAQDDEDAEALYWQQDWTCAQCSTWTSHIDYILAWRVLEDAKEGDAGKKKQWSLPDPKNDAEDAEVLSLISTHKLNFRLILLTFRL